jgi:polynucleotide 5'-kinase involved in rRNA processing
MNNKPVDIPHAWENLDFSSLSGILMIVGAPDVGKSTFARYLFQRLCEVLHRVAYLDGDPGQSTLGPPSTMTLALAKNGDDSFPPEGQRFRGFVGSVSPARHMLPIVTIANRLIGAAREAGMQVAVYDTTGLVDPARGGHYLKLSKINLLRPTVLFAIQRDRELESLLEPLRVSRHIHVVDLSPSTAAQRRDNSFRRSYRASQFACYFKNTSPLRLNWTRFAVFPEPRFDLHRLVAMEDIDGFTIGLGIVEQMDRIHKEVMLHTPVDSIDRIDAIRLGDIIVDPETFEDRPLTR